MAEIGASSYRRFQQERDIALDHILVTYSDALVRFAYGMVHNWTAAEDIAAESIAILLMKRKSFRDASCQRAYLYQIVRTKSIDYLRSHRHIVPLEDVESVIGCGDLEMDALKKERDAAINLCMQQLPRQYGTVLHLAYFEGFSPQDIALILRKNAKQVYNLLNRAKASLKILLEKEGITHEDL